ncbi:hypothetical protein AAMO2058_001146100 [Amorphochlora amoebiformis]
MRLAEVVGKRGGKGRFMGVRGRASFQMKPRCGYHPVGAAYRGVEASGRTGGFLRESVTEDIGPNRLEFSRPPTAADS